MLNPQIATSTDYPHLVALWDRSVRATHHFLTATDHAAIEQALPGYFAQVKLLKWQVGDTLVGFSGTADNDLVMLFLDPTYFRCGYGHDIVQQLLTADHIQTVTVNAQNPGALAFYRHEGFEIVSRSATDSDGRPYPIINLRYNPQLSLRK